MTIQTEKSTYLVPEWVIPILEDLTDFDIDFILQKVEEGKHLHTLHEAAMQ